MSDYSPTYTVQWRDYAIARRMQEHWRREVKMRKQQGESPLEAIHNAGRTPPAPLITEERPNPLSVELRIVLAYFWEMYNGCAHAARTWAGSAEARFRTIEAQGYLDDARNICFDLFSPASAYYYIHIHSKYGCNDEDCPAWKRGYEAAQENVLDWYEPNV